MVRVKICGVRTVEAAQAISAAGADLAGLNFVPHSRRRLDLEMAASIVRALGDVRPVGVFAGATTAEVEEIADGLGLEWIQLHGDEPQQLSAELSRRFRIIKAFSIDDTFTPAQLEAHVRWAELFLFDAPRPGSGLTFDWSRLPESPRPFLLAGGLTADNVTTAIERVTPFGVDTASGVETDGVQDPAKIAAFVEACRTER